MLTTLTLAGLGWIGCMPGTINTPRGSDQLVTALYAVEEDLDLDRMQILLANSKLSCNSSVYSFDPQTISENQADLAAAVVRENARIVVLELFRFRVESWEGYFPMVEDTVNDKLDDRTPYLSRAAYWGVNEAAVDDEDGLFRSYELVDVDYYPVVAEPGEVQITRDTDDRKDGVFRLDSLDVSGNFRAEQCNENAPVFTLMATLQAFEEDGEESDF